MHVAAQKWGNSLAVRIPKSLSVNANIVEGSSIELILVNGSIVMKPIIEKRKSLDEYLLLSTPENSHPETLTGDVIGREEW